MKARRRLVQLAAVGLSLGLVAAACGGDDDDDAGATTSAAEETTTSAAAEETTTTAGGTDTTEPAGEAFTIDAADCPADSTTPIPDGEPIKVAFVGPQTGPLAGFGLIGEGIQAFFNKVNEEEGGVDGHELQLITKDDAYDPARTVTAVQELLEKDKINASLIQVGTPNTGAVRDQYEELCVPQAYVGTGFPAWGDPAAYQFTVGGILAYNTEARLWAQYIADTSPGAKVGILTYNNDFGKAYSTAFAEAAEEQGLEITTEAFHEPTSTLNNEITQILASGPDVIVGATTATFCTELANQARTAGFEGPFVVSATCFSTQFLEPAGEAAVDTFGIGYLKDPTDTQYADDEAVQTYLADIEAYGEGADPAISSVATGYNFGSLMVDTLKQAAESGELTNVAIAEAMWNLSTKLPLAYEGAEWIINGNSDAYGVEFGEARQWDPAAKSFVSTGKSYNIEGETGLFGS